MKRKNYRRLCLGFDRTLAHDSLRQIGVLLLILVVAFCISFILLSLLSLFGNDLQNYCNDKHISMWALPFYLLIDSNTFTSIYDYTNIGSGTIFVCCLIYVAGVIIFTGMIISVMTNMIGQRIDSYRHGHIHYLKSGHYVIMGYDDMVPSIITHIFNQDKDNHTYILILTSVEANVIREKLMKSFPEEKMKRIIINYGHRTSVETYKAICLESAEEVFIVGNHTRPAHDAINVECVDSICHYLNEPEVTQKPNRITCVFKDLDTYTAFKTSDIFTEVRRLDIEFVPYNYQEGWAKQVFVERKYRDYDKPGVTYNYPAVYGKGISSDDDKYVHLVFVGITDFAVTFSIEAAHVLHFPNADKAKTRITFIDINADKEKDEFITRFRQFFEVQPFIYEDLSDEKDKEQEGVREEYVRFAGKQAGFLDIEFEFIKGNVFSKKVQDKIGLWAKEHEDKQYLSVFLAMADQRQNFVMGMNMPDDVYAKEVPVFIRQDRSDNFVTNLRNADMREEYIYSFVKKNGCLEQKRRNARYANIYPFGMNETAFFTDDIYLKRAKIINFLYTTVNKDTYKFQDMLAQNTPPIKTELDEKWQKLPARLKWSNLYSAYAIETKLMALRIMRKQEDVNDESWDSQPLSEDEVQMLAMIEHNRWNVEKLLMGYRKAYNSEDKYAHPQFADKLASNKDLFIHHDIRPFGKLDAVKDLDCEFSRYIPWIICMTKK